MKSCATGLGLDVSSETFSIRFFMENRKPRAAKCHVTPVLSLRLQLALHVWTAGRDSSCKWHTVRFFASKNWTASRIKARNNCFYSSAMCLLDFWPGINELFLFFGRWKWCTSTSWKTTWRTKQRTRSSNRFYISFCRTNIRKFSVPIQSLIFFFLFCYWIHNLTAVSV